jgi:hypothetical protein
MERKQEVRHECLLQLYGSGAIPLSGKHVRKVAHRGGFDYSEIEVRDALFFLVSQKFADDMQDPGTGEVRYRITATGILHWEKSEN